MVCSVCESEIPADSKFCEECGAPVGATCPTCGTAVSPGKRFCRGCGRPLAEEAGEAGSLAAVEPAAEPSSQVLGRRICSVLFCDLVGFTVLSEARDPEDVRDLLSRYFSVARTVIGRYGGVVEKFIGDAVMAVWGAPVATEEDAERAVRAGLDLVQSVGALAGEVGVADLSARVGVVTGEVALRSDAGGEGLAGDTVNTAARVQGVADPGTVLVDATTWELSRSAVAFTPAGEHLLKGKASPVALWRAEHVVSGMGGAQRVDGLEAPLVGRGSELRLMKELFHGCVERRSPRLVSITGTAGVGKSRLGWELEKYLDGLAVTVYWHRGRCLTYGDGVAFWALAEMVRARLGIAEEDPGEVVDAKLATGLERWVLDQSARDYIRPRLARLLGVGGDDNPLGREELFAGWRLFFEQLAAEAPVVLLVEDVHQADAGLLDFLEHLLDWARDVAIFVLTLGRPELLERRPGWGTRRNGTVLALEPLPDEAIATMLEAMVPGMSEPAQRAIVARAQGIPLYAVETVRMLIDRGAIRQVGPGYELVEPVETLAVPTSLQSLVAARLDALAPDARRLVADAAVLGGSFPPEALVAVSDLAEDQVRALLDELVRREVLTVRADRLSPEQGQYAFVQTLVRQVAYDGLSRRERKARHLAVAAHLARVFPDGGEEVSEVIAGHLLEALGALPEDPDVGELRERAMAALVRAGQRAERTGAPTTSGRSYARAAELHEEEGSPEAVLAAAGLWERAAGALLVAGDAPSAEGKFLRAAELYARHGRLRDAARARAAWAEAVRMMGRHEQARAALREALGVLGSPPDADTVTALRHLATLETFSGAAEEADGLLRQALGLAQELGLPDQVYTDLFIIYGIALGARSRPVESIVALREAARRAEEAEDGVRASRALLNLSSLLLATDPVGAAAAARRSVEHARRAGFSYVLVVASFNLSLALLLAGDWDGAAATVEEARAHGLDEDPHLAGLAVLLAGLRGQAGEVGVLLEKVRGDLSGSEDVQDRSFVALVEAMAASVQGQPAAVLRHAGQAMELGERMGVFSDAVLFGWPLAANAALELGETEQAERLVGWLDAHPAGHLPPVLRAERSRVHACIRARRGDPGAGEALERAVGELRACGSPYHLALGLLDRAEQLARAGHRDDAVALVGEAEQLGARLRALSLTRRALRVREALEASARAERGRVPAG